jgi:hypothetical protein
MGVSCQSRLVEIGLSAGTGGLARLARVERKIPPQFADFLRKSHEKFLGNVRIVVSLDALLAQ